jgi:CDP-glycerol glycerophosphotransferase
VSLIGGQRILADAALPLQFDDGDSPPPDWLTRTSSARDIRIFASLGRLSVENNPSRLIRAFALVYAAVPGSRLVVIGEGALATTLASQIVSLGLTGAVWVTGYRTNPFALIRRSECFVFVGSGGRDPRVLLEARVIGLPSVTVVAEPQATAPSHGVIEVEADDRAIAAGMLQFLDGRLGESSFDWVAHDDAAITMFYRAIGALSGE